MIIMFLTRHIEKKSIPVFACDDYVSSFADGTSVSTFLCTRKLGPEEVHVSVSLIAVYISIQISNELTEVLLQGSK